MRALQTSVRSLGSPCLQTSNARAAMLDLPYPGTSNVHLPADLLRAIGHVTALWAQLERLIDSTIRQMLDHPAAPEIDTALIMPFRKRLALLAELANRMAVDDHDYHTTAKGVTAEVAQLQRSRDLIVHGVVSNSETSRDGVKVYWFQRLRWDRPVRVLERKSFSIAEIERIAMAISDAVAIAGLLEIILWATMTPSRDRAAPATGDDPIRRFQPTRHKLASLLRSSQGREGNHPHFE